MKYLKIFLTVAGTFLLYILIFPKRLFAYLDAGSGSYIIQIIIAIALGGAFGIKIFWRKIYHFFKNLTSRVNRSDKNN
jgi:hypothetical protein